MTRVLIAKTALDGHWRGVTAVARALRDAGFEVILGGMARADEIVAMAQQEDIDLLGLNVGGSIEVVERIIDAFWSADPEVPIFAGGTVSPASVHRLQQRGITCFPPGSSMSDIVEQARRLTAATDSSCSMEAAPESREPE